MIKHLWVKVSLSLFIFILLPNAHAIECNAESPNLKKQGDEYYDIKGPVPLSHSQKTKISRLFSRLNGEQLEGKGTFTECTGPERIARKQTRDETIKGEASKDSTGKVTFRLEAYRVDKKTTRLETLRYFGNLNPHHISELTDNKLVVFTKLRKNNIFVEEITEFAFGDNSVRIEITRYIGGYFASHYVTKLRF